MFVTVNDLNTYYTKEDGENAVLFLHGCGCDSSTMKVLAENIDRPVVSLDLWGFGQSEAPHEVWGSHEYASALARFCDSAGLRKTDIVAHSFGGRIALALAADMPERVGKIVLAGGAGLRKKSFVRWLKQKAFKICRKTGMNTKFAGSDDYRSGHNEKNTCTRRAGGSFGRSKKNHLSRAPHLRYGRQRNSPVDHAQVQQTDPKQRMRESEKRRSFLFPYSYAVCSCSRFKE